MLEDYKRILIVDDEKDTVSFLERGLSREGFEVIVAFDGIEAKNKIVHDEPKVILLDLVMPGLDGWGVLKWMKERKLNIPTIIVSARDEMEDMKRGILEADTYLVKPVSVSDVLKGINVICSLQTDNKEGKS
ncbi:MAG: response regulator [Omnitrophica bacterium]|nr:response regulator [Candidatus Omnitrophota bacterium]